MTSKTLFYKFVRDNRKHKAGVILLSIIFAVGLAFGFLCCVHNLTLTEANILSMEKKTEIILGLVNPNSVLAIFMLGMGAIFAANSFLYLHAKSKVDFYHSLPIKREKIYLANIINDLLIFVIPFLAAIVIICISAAPVGGLSGTFTVNIVNSFICYLIAFLLSYMTTVLAVLMTGNRLTCLLGLAVFMSYVPAILRGIIPLYSTMFFSNCQEAEIGAYSLNYFSPVTLACMMTGLSKWTWAQNGKYVVFSIAAILILFALCGVLYKRRSSEAAGKSMAFAGSKAVIRIALVIPLSLYAGCLFYGILMETSKIWILVGAIVGAIFVHAFIEAVYQSDIRGMLAHKKQLAACVIVSLVIIGIFWTDPFHYNTYVPKAENVESLSVRLNHYPGSTYNFWDDDFMAIKGEGLEDLLNDLSDVAESSLDESEHTINVVYRMKNGRNLKRYYRVSEKVQEAMAKKIFDTPEYKKEVYYLYQEKWDTIIDLYTEDGDSNSFTDLSKKERQEFLKVYLEDLDTLTFKEMKSVIPLASFEISYQTSKESGETLGEQYFIYPTFKKTLAYCKEKGIEIPQPITDFKIEELTVNLYDSEYNLINDYKITQKDEINELIKKLGYSYAIENSGYSIEDDFVDIEAKAYKGNEEYYLTLTPVDEKTTQELVKRGEKE